MNWTAVSAIATAAAAGAAFIYVVLTYQLWSTSADQVRMLQVTRETELMLRLMTDYDSLRTEVRTLQEWGGSDVRARAHRFSDERRDAATAGRSYNIDEARFAISRFFVRIRKLNLAGYLSEDVIVNALSASAIRDVFLGIVDPLDEIAGGSSYWSIDRDYFASLLERRYPPRKTTAQKGGAS